MSLSPREQHVSLRKASLSQSRPQKSSRDEMRDRYRSEDRRESEAQRRTDRDPRSGGFRRTSQERHYWDRDESRRFRDDQAYHRRGGRDTERDRGRKNKDNDMARGKRQREKSPTSLRFLFLHSFPLTFSDLRFNNLGPIDLSSPPPTKKRKVDEPASSRASSSTTHPDEDK